MNRFVIRKTNPGTISTAGTSRNCDNAATNSLNIETEGPPLNKKKKTSIGNSATEERSAVEEANSNDSNSINIPEGVAEGNKRKSYKQKYKNTWQSKFPWVELRSKQQYCNVCKKALNGGITHLQRHEDTTYHQGKIKEASTSIKLDTYLKQNYVQQSKLVKSGELKMTMFLHEHNLPLSLMDHFPKLIASVCPDSNIAKVLKCGRTKATNLTKHCIATERLSIIREQLKHNMFSIIIDETTDISIEKCLAIIVRFYDQDKCRDHFFGLLKVSSSTAEDLFNSICTRFNEEEIPLTNIIGLAADNASVMMGNIRGVRARFQQILPNIFVLGCVCHSFHLCSSAAAKKLPRSLEDLIRGIYNYFSHSSKRTERLKEFQTFMELKPHKLLRPSQTRWLSLQAALDRVLENWEALILFFTNECFADDLMSTQTMLNQLKNPIFKIYFTFLSYILEVVNRLNLEFQAEKPRLHLLLRRVSDLYRNVLRNYMQKDYLDHVTLKNVDPSNPRKFVQIESIYFGARTEVLLTNKDLDSTEVQSFRINALNFYIELTKQIGQRFDFNDPVLSFVSSFDPKKAIRGEIKSIAAESLKNFPQLVDDIAKLDCEWRLVADFNELKEFEKETIEEFWTKVVNIHNNLNELMFPHLAKLIKGILALPHSSAASERIFSQLNLLKTKTRNKLHVNTCDSILHAKELLDNQPCYLWEPSNSLINRKSEY